MFLNQIAKDRLQKKDRVQKKEERKTENLYVPGCMCAGWL